MIDTADARLPNTVERAKEAAREGARRTLIRYLLLTLMAAGCSTPATEPLADATSPPVAVPTTATPVDAGICVDGTGSVPTRVVTLMVDAIKMTLSTWVPRTTDRVIGTAPVPALDLRLRRVLGGSSISADGEVLHVEVPAVPGVIPKPAASDANYIALARAWREQSAAADAAGQQALGLVDAALPNLDAIDWSADSSEIYGCLEGLARTVQAGPVRRLVVATDLQQTDPAQFGQASFDGAHVLVVHVAVDLNEQSAQRAAIEGALRDRGAASISFAVPELLPDVLITFLREGSHP